MKRLKIRTAGVIITIVVLLLLLVGGTVYAAQDSLPGDGLYPVKLAAERAGVMLRGNDVVRAERALSFANRRVREMAMLTEREQLRYLSPAVGKYEQAMNMTLARIRIVANNRLRTGNITAMVAEATTHHLLVLDIAWDTASSEGKLAIARAREVAQRGQENALSALANESPGWAMQINLAAMGERLNRVRVMAEHGNTTGIENAIWQCEGMTVFGDKIYGIAQQVGKDTQKIEEFVASAACRQLEELAEVWGRVSEPAQPVMERVMAKLLIQYRWAARAMEHRGVESPRAPVIPEPIRQRLEEGIREQQRMQQQQMTSMQERAQEQEVIQEQERARKEQRMREQRMEGRLGGTDDVLAGWP